MEGSRVLSCPRKREKTIIKERKERRQERGGGEKKSWTLNLSGSKGGKVRSVDYHFDQSRYRGFAVQTIFAVRFFLICRANNVCRAFFSHFAVQTIFAVRFSVTLPCVHLCRAPVQAFAVHMLCRVPSDGKGAFAVRAAHGKEWADGNAGFSRSGRGDTREGGELFNHA